MEKPVTAFNEKRWTELRDKRRRKETLDRDESEEWHLLDAARDMRRAQAKMARAREISRKRLNSVRMELGTIAVDAGLHDAPRDRIRQALETLARELDAEAGGNADGARTADPSEPDSPDARILAAVAAIPEGAVMTCGQVAESVGLSGQGRTVIDVLARHSDAPGWHRVVDAEGHMFTPPGRDQRTMLEDEGVGFTLTGVDLHRFGPGTGA